MNTRDRCRDSQVHTHITMLLKPSGFTRYSARTDIGTRVRMQRRGGSGLQIQSVGFFS